MRAEAFREFLSTVYRASSGEPLGHRPVSDAISRCRRVEGALDVDLDTVIPRKGVEHLREEMARSDRSLGIEGNQRHGRYSLANAVRLYSRFLEWESASKTA